MDYKASLDSSTKIITIVVVVFLVLIIVHLLRTAILYYKARQYGIPIAYLIISIIMVAMIISAFGLNVSKYQIIDDNLIIVTPFHKKTLNKSLILSATVMDKNQLAGLTRTSGIGGLFGYYGWFRTVDLDKLFFYASQKRNYVLIQMKNGDKFVITPDDTGLVNQLK